MPSSMPPISELRPEQQERLAGLIELLNRTWGPIRNVVRSSGGIFGAFDNVPLSQEEIWIKARAQVAMNYLAPQQIGGKADMNIVSGELPHNIQFMAQVRPAIQPGCNNIEINLYPTIKPDERDAVQLENVFRLCEQLLGKQMQRDGVLTAFIQRQLLRAGDRRPRLAAEIAELLADEFRANS